MRGARQKRVSATLPKDLEEFQQPSSLAGSWVLMKSCCNFQILFCSVPHLLKSTRSVPSNPKKRGKLCSRSNHHKSTVPEQTGLDLQAIWDSKDCIVQGVKACRQCSLTYQSPKRLPMPMKPQTPGQQQCLSSLRRQGRQQPVEASQQM